MKIIKIERSNKLSKRFRAILDNGDNFDFGQEHSDGTHPITYIDGATKEKRDNYLKRHFANKIEANLIQNLIPSPSLFSYYLLWNTPSINENVKILNKLLRR